MRHQSNGSKNRINQTGLHCVWTRSDRTPGAPLTARWVFDQQPQTPSRDSDGRPNRKRDEEDRCSGINSLFG